MILIHVIISIISIILISFCFNKLLKYNEKFVADFDEVLDKKCYDDSNRQSDNYMFDGSGLCKKNECPLERCSSMRLNTRTNQNEFVVEISKQRDFYDTNGDFQCETKESIENNIYCDTPVPYCNRLGEEDFCFEFQNDKWEKKEYVKILKNDGTCSWQNKTNSTIAEGVTDSYFEECLKEAVNCSLCNIPCATIPEAGTLLRDNYQKYILDTDGKCIPDPDNGCFDCDETLTKIAYRLYSDERRLEPVFFRKQIAFDGICVYLDEDGNCHPDDVSTYPTYCTQNDNLLLPEDVETGDCSSNAYKFCCNLNDRDMFEKTKYRSVLSRDGRKCVYISVDKNLSKELDINDPTGFNCPGYDFRLCQDEDEFRNVASQRCTGCPEGQYTKDNTQLHSLLACDTLPDCSQDIDYCFENVNTTGTIQKKVAYEKVPHVERQPGASQATATCVESTPPSCISSCNGRQVLVRHDGTRTTDVYCDYCRDGKKMNPITFECEDEIPCPNIGNQQNCYDRNFNQFFDYTVSQSDPFSECLMKRVSATNIPYTMDIVECTDECPAGYVKDQATQKCEIPECVFNKSFTVIDVNNNANTIPFDNQNQVEHVFDNINMNEVKHSEQYCRIKKIKKDISVSAKEGNYPVCQVKDNTPRIPEVNTITGRMYKVNTARATEEKQGANGDCPVDCSFSPPVFNNTCVDKIRNDKNDPTKQRTCYYEDEQDQNRGITTTRYNVSEEPKHYGKTCEVRARELIGQRYDNQISGNVGNRHIILESECILPQCDVDCIQAGHTTNCTACSEKRGTQCQFEKTCELTILQRPFGNGTPCTGSPTASITCLDNEMKCENCRTEYRYNDVAINKIREIYGSTYPRDMDNTWAQIPNDASSFPASGQFCGSTNSITYSREEVVKSSGNCLYGNNPLTNGDIVDTESKTVSKCGLTQDEIDSVCNDNNNFTWTPKTNTDICDCTNRDKTITETGTLTGDHEIREMNITCDDKEKTISCHNYYDSENCIINRRRTRINAICDDDTNFSWSPPCNCTDSSIQQTGTLTYNTTVDDVKVVCALPKTKDCSEHYGSQECIDERRQAAADEDKDRYCREDLYYDWTPACDCFSTDFNRTGTIKPNSPYQCDSKTSDMFCRIYYNSPDCQSERAAEAADATAKQIQDYCNDNNNYTNWSPECSGTENNDIRQTRQLKNAQTFSCDASNMSRTISCQATCDVSCLNVSSTDCVSTPQCQNIFNAINTLINNNACS